jgi:hypothetical protein
MGKVDISGQEAFPLSMVKVPRKTELMITGILTTKK